MRMTTCREPNGCITQVQILISKGRSYSFRRDNHLSYRKESWGCNIQLGTEVSNWLHQRLWKDHHLRLAERIPLHSRGQIYGGQSVALGRCAECRWSGSGTKDLISGDFHFAVKRLNPGNNSLREIPIKRGRSRAVWAILFNDGTLKRRGHLIHFRHEFRQIPLPSVVNTFSSGKLTAHRRGTLFLCTKIPFWHRATAALEYRLSVDSQTTVICNQPCPPPASVRSRPGFVCRISHLIRSWDRQAKGFTVTGFSITLFSFWLSASSPWSKHRVIICSLRQLWITRHISFADCFHLNSSFVNIKNIFWTSLEVTKTKQTTNEKSTHPSLDGC